MKKQLAFKGISEEIGLPRFRATVTRPAPSTQEEAETEILKEMLDRHSRRAEGEKLDHDIVTPPATLEDIRRQVQRVTLLSPISMLRISRRFLNETDPKKH